MIDALGEVLGVKQRAVEYSLAPHVAWLFADRFAAFGYALSSHASGTVVDTALAAVGFLAGTVGYLAVPALLAFVLARPDSAALRDTLWPSDAPRRFALVAFAAPLLIATLAAFAADAQIVSLWAMPAFALLPVVLLSSPRLVVPQVRLMPLIAFAVLLPVRPIVPAMP